MALVTPKMEISIMLNVIQLSFVVSYLSVLYVHLVSDTERYREL